MFSFWLECCMINIYEEELMMAKYVKSFKGNYHNFVRYIENEVVQGSMSASIEDKHIKRMNDVVCTVLVFERFSYTGGNRVSMNLTILGEQDNITLIAITSGGSQATFFKINTWGESSFLDTLIDPVEDYIRKNRID